MVFWIIRICSLIPKYALAAVGQQAPGAPDLVGVLGEGGMFVIVFALFVAFVKQYL